MYYNNQYFYIIQIMIKRFHYAYLSPILMMGVCVHRNAVTGHGPSLAVGT